MDEIKTILNTKEDKPHYIYVHTCPNGRKYIGRTKNPKKRWKPCLYKGNKEFYDDIVKYGWDNIKHEILAITYYGWVARKLENDLIHKYIKVAYNISNIVYENYLQKNTRLHKKS